MSVRLSVWNQNPSSLRYQVYLIFDIFFGHHAYYSSCLLATMHEAYWWLCLSAILSVFATSNPFRLILLQFTTFHSNLVLETSCYLLDKTCTGCLSPDNEAPPDSSALSPGPKSGRMLSSLSSSSTANTSSSSSTSSTSSCHYVIRWPSECQVLPYRIRHIKSLPSAPEVFYEPTGRTILKVFSLILMDFFFTF